MTEQTLTTRAAFAAVGDGPIWMFTSRVREIVISVPVAAHSEVWRPQI